MAKKTAAEPADPPAEQAEQDAQDAVEVQDAELPEVAETQSDKPGGQVDILLETVVPVSASLGQAEMEVRELLQLGPG